MGVFIQAVFIPRKLLTTTKFHEPVGRVQFVVLKKINKCLFTPNCTIKIMWLRIGNIHEKIGNIHKKNTILIMQKQSACIKYKSNLFKPCKWLCAFGQEKTRTLRSKQYTMIFSHIKRAKNLKVRLNSSRNCSFCVRITFDETESSFPRFNQVCF